MAWLLVLSLLGCGTTEPPAAPAPNKTAPAKAKQKAKTKQKAKAPAPVEMVPATIYLVDTKAQKEGKEPVLVAVERQVGKLAPEKNAVWNVFKGPTEEEAAKGLASLKSGAQGFEGFTLADGVATLKLRGGCSGEGGTLTVYDQLHKTLTGFDTVEHVKLLGPTDAKAPEGKVDHRPDCLQP